MKKHYLATTGFSKIWDSDSDILLLGPWCQNEATKGYSVLPSPWQPRLKLKEGWDYCYSLYREMLPELSHSLNLIHGLSKSDRYWSILIGPWLTHFIGIVYDRHKRLEAAIKSFPDLYSSVLPLRQCQLWTGNTYDLLSIRGQATTDYYNLKLFSLIFRHLYPERVVEISVKRPDSEAIKNGSWRLNLGWHFGRVKNLFCHPEALLSDMYNISDSELASLQNGSKIIHMKFSPHPKRENGYCDNLREGIRFKEAKDNFTRLLHALIPKGLPLCYLENYYAYAKRVRVMPSLKLVGSAIGWYFNEPFKFFAAESIARGAKAVEFQHGGGYGTCLSFPAEEISLEKDRFYTWGWRNKSDKIIPLSSPYLSRLYNSYRNQREDILFIGNGTHRYLNRLFTCLTPDDMPKYFQDKCIFLRFLSREARKFILYRPYQEVGWREIENIKKSVPGIRLLTSKNLIPWMQKSRLAVIDHQTTPLIEALTINIPSVFFWDSNIELLRPEAQGYFNLLKEAGILYETPHQAANKVNEIYREPLAWWQEKNVQRARDEFCRNFAMINQSWQEEWRKALGAGG